MTDPFRVLAGLALVAVLIAAWRPAQQWLIDHSPAPIHRFADFSGMCDHHP